MKSLRPVILSLLPAIVRACGDHPPRKREAALPALAPPSRPLEWGDINIIHTTDSHGWLLGHTKASFPEPNYRCRARARLPALTPAAAATWATLRRSWRT